MKLGKGTLSFTFLHPLENFLDTQILFIKQISLQKSCPRNTQVHLSRVANDAQVLVELLCSAQLAQMCMAVLTRTMLELLSCRHPSQ
jgi:hypothetical protein